MNVKFRMPRFKGDVKFQGTFREITLTTLATTISIVLTFGTAHYVEQLHTKQARRLMAMTIVNDIDQSLNVVKKLLDNEERGHDVTSYLINNIDSLEKISDDSLFIFFNYISHNSFDTSLEFKKANENIFNSSQDSWRTLNDRKFLNNVQDFYNARAVIERQIKEWVYFKKPLTDDEEYELLMNSDVLNTRQTFIPVCRKLLSSNKVQKYLGFYQERVQCYRSLLDYRNMNEENKFLMNITEKELEDFVNQTYMAVNPASESELIGTWKAVTADDRMQTIFEFRDDHTFTTHQTATWGHSIYTGFIIQKFTYSGTWSIEGDSLIKHYDLKSRKIDIDDSAISFQPSTAAEVKQFINELATAKYIPAPIKQLEQQKRRAHATNLDQSGTRIELTESDQKPVHYRKELSNIHK